MSTKADRRRIVIAGLGASPAQLTAEAARETETAEHLFGAARMLESFIPEAEKRGQGYSALYKGEDIRAVIEEKNIRHAVILLSGDVGFYSAAAGLTEALSDYHPLYMPGIASPVCFFARLGRPWQDARLLSFHGRDTAVVAEVRRNACCFFLCGKNHAELAGRLCDAGFEDLICTLGERLGYEDERIRRMTARELMHAEADPLAVVVVDNPEPDERIPAGLPDEAFVRGEVPMTKAPVRALIYSKLCPAPDDIIWDVGCGTGSVTVELALAAWRGKVYGVDSNEEAVRLTERNARLFHLENITASRGRAPEALCGLPAPDAVFIGGSKGQGEAILDLILEKNPRARILASAITLESAASLIRAMEARGLHTEVVQIAAAHGKKAGTQHMLIANNPITLIGGSKPHE